jgi:hypothetical protein
MPYSAGVSAHKRVQVAVAAASIRLSAADE